MDDKEKIESANNQPARAIDVARYLIGLAQKNYEEMTNLRLQKLLYYAWGTYWNLYKKHLFEDDIEAWDYGPVVRDVYIEFCESKKDTLHIKEQLLKETENNINDNVKKFLQAFFNAYKDKSTNALVKASHEETPWKDTYKEGQKLVIPKEKIENFFEIIK